MREHPLGRAIVAAAGNAGLDIGESEAFRAEPGRGVVATVRGHAVAVGTADGAGLDGNAATVVEDLRSAGQTAVVVTVDGSHVGVLGLRDQLRATAVQAVAALAPTTGGRPVLVTGDHSGAAAAVAAYARGISTCDVCCRTRTAMMTTTGVRAATDAFGVISAVARAAQHHGCRKYPTAITAAPIDEHLPEPCRHTSLVERLADHEQRSDEQHRRVAEPGRRQRP